MYFPPDVKKDLIQMHAKNVVPSTAYEMACKKVEGDPTFTPDSVKTLFSELTKVKDEVTSLRTVLQALREEGHFVEIYVDENSIIQRLFVVYQGMEEVFKAFGSFITMDATYCKNNAQYPMQVWVVLTNENKVAPVACSATRHEEKQDYVWIVECFYKKYGRLPATIVIDGDQNMYDAISEFANEQQCTVSILTCLWHLWNSIERNATNKLVNPDTYTMKGSFYKMAKSTDEDDFEAQWKKFLSNYGKSEKMQTYLEEEIYKQKERWACCYTKNAFFAQVHITTGISESLHSLLASSTSGNRSLTELLVLVDKVFISQMQAHIQKIWKRQKFVSALQIWEMNGHVIPSIADFLSLTALKKLKEINGQAGFCKYEEEDGAFVVNDPDTGQVHVVRNSILPIGAENHELRSLIESAKINTDVGREICPVCVRKDVLMEDGKPVHVFRLPANWNKLYTTLEAKKRVLWSLGIAVPKKQVQKNNHSHTSTRILDQAISYYEKFFKEAEGSKHQTAVSKIGSCCWKHRNC